MKTITLNDYEVQKLIDGFSITVGDTLITFSKGSKRYIKGDEE